MKILITSGGCKVPIDDVRHIGNFSSGRYGANLAEKFLEGMHEVYFFHEKGSETIKDAFRFSKLSQGGYKDYEDYLQVKTIIKLWQPDIIISAAAISDYIVDKTEGKISSDNDELVIRLKKGEKVIQSFRELAPNAYIVGFKCLVSPTEEEKYQAISKQLNYVDQVIYNDLTKLREGKSKREFVHWVEDGRVCSSEMEVHEIVEEIIIGNFFKSK